MKTEKYTVWIQAPGMYASALTVGLPFIKAEAWRRKLVSQSRPAGTVITIRHSLSQEIVTTTTI